jgi:hypothetical protein
MYHFAGNPNQLHANATNSHYSGLLTDTTGPVTGCVGPTTAQEAALRGPIYQYGGNGYGMDLNQPLAGFRLPSVSSYANVGINSSSNLGAARYYAIPSGVIKGGKRIKHNKNRKLILKGGTGGESNYYGFNGKNEDLSLFAGSGYPPYTKGIECNTNVRGALIGGAKSRRNAKRSGKKGGKSLKKRGHKKTHSTRRHSSNKRRTVKSLYAMNGGMSDFAGETGGYSSGGIKLSANESYLANPTIIKPYSTCNGVPRV